MIGWLALAAWLGAAVGLFLGIGLGRASRRRRVEDTSARDERLWHEANPGCACLWSPLTGHERQCPAWTPPATITGLFNADHSNTAAMQRGDGERLTPPVPPATSRRPS